MISCETARDLLLEAEPAELRGEGDGALARHVRGCPACRQRATFLLGETDVLRATMDAFRPSRRKPSPAPSVVRRLRTPATGRGLRILLPLALAAGIAALVLVRRDDVTPPSAPLHVTRATPPVLDVQVPAAQSVAVFQTANPNIVVIWSY